MNIVLKDGERIDWIGPKTQIIQSDDFFASSLDAILLANFSNNKNNKEQIVVDLGSGTGAVGMLYAQKTKAQITMIDIQKDLTELNQRSVELNQLEKQIKVINADMNDIFDYLPKNKIDHILINPPYFPVNSDDKRMADDLHLKIARHEVKVNLEQIIQIAKLGLKNQGRISMVHRPERLVEILSGFNRAKIEPKRLQFVRGKKDNPANMILLEAVKGAKPGIEILPDIIAYDDDDNQSQFIKDIYYGK